MRFLAMVVGAILSLIAALHLYWGAGGKWGAAAAVPELHGRAVIDPGPLACAVVAALLLAAALLVVSRAGLVALPGPRWIVAVGTWTVALVLLLRGVGDFKFFGLFRSVTGTVFARNDAFFYTPLCLCLAAVIGLIAWHGPAGLRAE